MKTFDCSLKNKIPAMEIEAETEQEAQALYLEAVQRAVNASHVEAVEVEIV